MEKKKYIKRAAPVAVGQSSMANALVQFVLIYMVMLHGGEGNYSLLHNISISFRALNYYTD